MERGQLTGSLPLGAASPKSTSATPCPSVPGNHAARSARQSGSWSVDDERPPGDDDHDGRNAGALHLGEHAAVLPVELQRVGVAVPLGVRRLADDDDRDVVARVEAGRVPA